MQLLRFNHVDFIELNRLLDSSFSSNNFSFPSAFNLTSIPLSNPTKPTNLSCSYNIKLNPANSVCISVFHNLFYPEAIYNNQIEKINWSLKSKGKIICSGNVKSGHQFQFDESLISGSNGAISKSFLETNPELYQTIRNNLEELNKHFFHFTLDLSAADGATEFELKFEFPDFKPGYSVNDVKLSFNDVVPVIDVIRKQESFEGLRKGFNLWSLSKTDRSNFLGISSVWLRNRFNQTEHISELDFKKSTESESNYKLISSNSYPEREQEIIYLKNYIPLPYNKSDKDNLVGKLKESKPLDNNERTIVADALSRNYAEPTMNKNKLDLIINNCFEDKAEVYANYLFSTSDISKSEKPLFYKGNEVEYETIQVNLESASKIQIQSLSSKYDFYRAAIEFFGPENIDNADVVYNRDFTQEGIWQPTLNIQLIFNSKFQPDFSQWTYFTAICRSRCLYADVAMNFSYEIKS